MGPSATRLQLLQQHISRVPFDQLVIEFEFIRDRSRSWRHSEVGGRGRMRLGFGRNPNCHADLEKHPPRCLPERATHTSNTLLQGTILDK